MMMTVGFVGFESGELSVVGVVGVVSGEVSDSTFIGNPVRGSRLL